MPQAFDSHDKDMYVISNIGRDKAVLVEYDPITNKEVREIYSDPDYDLTSIFFENKNRILVSVSWESDKAEEYFFDEKWRTRKAALDEHFPGYITNFVSFNDDLNRCIVFSYSDKLAGKYYLYNFESGAISEVANPRSWLKEEDMAEMKPIQYYSRDSLLIHGYLTLPKGLKPEKLPVVVNPHGGPWGRDGWYFSPEVQFLSNRGYAVSQDEFSRQHRLWKKIFRIILQAMGEKNAR